MQLKQYMANCNGKQKHIEKQNSFKEYMQQILIE